MVRSRNRRDVPKVGKGGVEIASRPRQCVCADWRAEISSAKLQSRWGTEGARDPASDHKHASWALPLPGKEVTKDQSR